MIRADRVSFGYGGTPVLENVSFEIRDGASVGILGQNGSGKTTLLKLVAGALEPSSGTITLDGTRLSACRPATIARRIAVVPQDTHPAFDYSVLEIALMGRYPWLGPFEIEGPDDLAAALDALQRTGTADLAHRPFHTLSGGERQRVVIASALAQLDHRTAASPGGGAMLLLDEPTTSLDLRYQLEVASLVRRLQVERGVTLLLSTHDLRLAAAVCSHLILLRRGTVLAEGSPQDLLSADWLSRVYDVSPELVAPVLP